MLADRTVLCPVLIGRAAPLATVERALARAREGAGGVLVVSGEAGVGKSRLLRALAERAREGGWLVLRGACFAADRALPYAPLLDLVRGYVATSSPAAVAHALRGALPELLAHFPELERLLPLPDDAPRLAAARDPEQAQRRLLHALGMTFEALARTQPVVVVIEDVHWSDDATLDLAHHLARTAATSRLLLAVSLRSDEPSPGLSRLLAELDRLRVVTEASLARLTSAETGAMLSAIFGSDGPGAPFAAELHALTDGNPFFVEEVLKALLLSGELATEPDGRWRARPLAGIRAPRTAVEAVRRRLAGLGEGARELATLSAVAGRRVDFALLAALTRQPEAVLVRHVRELVDAQLVVEEGPDRFAFRHALTREAIAGELLARERAAIHRALVDVLEARHAAGGDAPAADLAHHAFEAGEWTRAHHWSVRAAEEAMRVHAPREAVAQVERASHAGARAGIAPSMALLRLAGQARETLGDFEGARGAFEAALALAQGAGDRAAEWEALHALGLLWAARDYARAGAYREDALSVARAIGDPILVARSLDRVGNWYVNVEQPARALALHAEALALFERAGDETRVAETTDLVAMAWYLAGDLVRCQAEARRAAAMFERLDNRRGLSSALALAELAAGAVENACTVTQPCAEPVGSMCERAAAIARDIGWRAGEAFALYLLAGRTIWIGDWERAMVAARESAHLAGELAHLQWRCGAARALAHVRLELLDPAGAVIELAPAYDMARTLGSRTWMRWLGSPLAVAEARSGRLDRARELLDDAARAGGTMPARAMDDDTLTLGERLVWAARGDVALAAGDAEEAVAIAEARLAAERRAHGAHAAIPRLELLRGQGLLAAGRLEEAVVVLTEAARQAEARGVTTLAWRALAGLGHAHRRARHRLEAREAFDRARAVAESLAERVPDVALRAGFLAGLAREIPTRPEPTRRQAAAAAHGGLTRRERDTAALVAEGRSNRAIARALGIGERTVESHVASALAKLGFESRVQLAGWAVAEGLVRGETPASPRSG